MKEINNYIIEKLKIDKNTKVPKINKPLEEIISDLSQWEDLKDDVFFNELLDKNNLKTLKDFKYIYKGGPFNELKLNETGKYILDSIKTFKEFPSKTKDELNDLVNDAGRRREVCTGNEDLSKVVEKYTLNDKLIGFTIYIEIPGIRDSVYLTFIL